MTPVEIEYTNWKGMRGFRTVLPLRIWFGKIDQYPEPAWFLEAWCFTKGDARSFRLSGIHSIKEIG